LIIFKLILGLATDVAFNSYSHRFFGNYRKYNKGSFHTGVNLEERGNKYMDTIAMIGLGAAALSTVSLLPQLARVWKTKSVKDISTGYCGVMFTSVALWLTYGILSADVPVIAANSVVVVQSAAILGFKAKYQPGALMPVGLAAKLGFGKIKSSSMEAESDTGIQFYL
jgi:MtN3 and saliva related transmembrane protein